MAPDPDAVAIIRDHVNFNPLLSTGSEPSSWKQLPELPSAAELLNSEATTNDLPTFLIDQGFPSKAHYLEALYKILRFEGIEGLRYSVNDFRSRPAMTDDQNTCVYTKVSLPQSLCHFISQCLDASSFTLSAVNIPVDI